MELTRKQVIEILEKADSTVYKEPKTITAQALEQAMVDVRKMEVIEQIYKKSCKFPYDLKKYVTN
jgi:hypothetical protein